ncbi:MAG TPA: ABC transporter ATP-binding protein, partial [Thermomicrobiales bacterium]|nr:ABC transporter ATP-binding protein [Thermomicrobiales bacterium]
MSAIEAWNLVKRFGQKVAVDDTSFEVADGEFFVFVGPSGCGKTTTLRLLAGLEPVTSGRIAFGEKVVTNIRPKDRNVAMVFQDYAIFPHLTVFENIAYGLRSRHAPRGEIGPRVTEAAKTFRIDHLLQRKPRQLSGGERQRVGVARALAADPPVLLMDEPFGAVDPIVRERLQNELLRLQEQLAKTILFVTHDIDEAIKMGDLVAVLQLGGHLAQYGTPDEILANPASDFVARFVGADRGLKRLALVRVGDLDLR